MAALALSVAQDGVRPSLASPLISTTNIVPELGSMVVKLDSLGKGSTSRVFRAVHVDTLQLVALKDVAVSSDAARSSVRREVRALCTQRSPLMRSGFTADEESCSRMVEYYGVSQANGNVSIAVEYVAGGNLKSWIDNGFGFPEPWLAHLAHQALEALCFLHRRGRTHRDIKPANLLITREGDLKLADFGLATDDNNYAVVGTRRFMAPERLQGGGAAPSSDLWSLGLSLATAALRESPVSKASNEFEQICLAESASKAISGAQHLSSLFVGFLTQCLAPSPEGRPPPEELMGHPFLELRHGWEQTCPQVVEAMRNDKQQSAARLTVAGVVDAIVDARVRCGLGRANASREALSDLAYELCVPPRQLQAALKARESAPGRHLSSREGGSAVCGAGSGNRSPSDICVDDAADLLKAELPVRDRLSGLRVYPRCFTGREAVSWMLNAGVAHSPEDAVMLGGEMLKAGVFEHVTNEHLFEDRKLLYTFTEDGRGGAAAAPRRRHSLTRLAKTGLASVGRALQAATRDARPRSSSGPLRGSCSCSVLFGQAPSPFRAPDSPGFAVACSMLLRPGTAGHCRPHLSADLARTGSKTAPETPDAWGWSL